MASNVNVKFVAILASSLLLLAAVVAGAAYVTMKNSAADHIRAGDQYMAAGEYEDAAKSYSKAVNSEQTNIDYLLKWQEALVNTIPETELEYTQGYNDHYLGILRRLAALQITDPQAQRDMIDAMYMRTKYSGSDAQNWSNFLNSCDSSYENLEMTDPEAKSLLRYRGFARVALMPIVALTTKDHDQAVDDLNAAFEADPTDIESLIKLADLYRLDWIQARTSNRPAATESSMVELTATIDRMRDQFPDDPRFLARELNFNVESKVRVDSSLAGQLRIRQELRGIEEPLIESFLTSDPDLLDTELLVNTLAFGRAIWNLRTDDYNEIGLQITSRILESRPDDFDLQYFHSIQLMIANRYDDAHESLQQTIDLPDLPISLDGIRLKRVRINALFQQANNALSHLAVVEDEPAREALLNQVNDLNDLLIDKQGENSSMALMIGAKIATAEQRFSDAVSLLQQLNSQTSNENIEVIRLLARSLAAQGTLGAALVQYDKWIELDDLNPQPQIEAAQIYLKLRDPELAIERLVIAQAILPDNEEIKSQLNTLLVSTGANGDQQAQDPVIAEMIRAESLANSGVDSMPAAIEILLAITESNPDDARPLAMLVEYMARTGDTDGALAIARRGQDLLPGNETFNRFVALLSTGDRMQIALEYIDKGSDPEPVKLIKKYALMIQLDEQEKAQAYLDDAAARFPTHPTVLDALFVIAIQGDDLAKAREIASVAALHNADQADGLLYQARINIKEDALPAALSNLELAVKKASLSPQAWRLYGQVLLKLGRTEEGVEALAKANTYKPNDAEISKAYAATLIQLQRFDQALDVVRSARRFTSTDKNLNEMWLALESKSGDSNLSIEHRIGMHANNPEDSTNTRALISLLTQEGRFDEAGELIQETIEAGGSDLGLIMMQARWYAEQGRVDEGHRLILTYIEGLDGTELDETPYLAMGNFLIRQGRADAGIEAFRKGAELQSMEMMSADRRLGDYFFTTGNYEEAYTSYRKVTKAGADESGVVSKRIIETLQRLKRWDEAENELDKLSVGVEEDTQTALLRADIAYGRGDLRSARIMVNRAIELSPNRPEPFIRRAQLEFNDKDRLSFVLSDLAQAIRLSPASVQPRIMRTIALQNNNRSAEAIAELHRGIEAIPENAELHKRLVEELWESGRHGEAHAATQDAIEAFDQSPIWLMVAGDLASSDDKLQNNWSIAKDFFRRAYEVDRSLVIALRLANACLYVTPPDANAAIDAIDAQGDLKETHSQLLILKARAINVLGSHDEAIKFAKRSITAATSASEVRHWFLHMETIFDVQSDLLAFINDTRAPELLMPVYTVHAALFQASDIAQHKQIIIKLSDSEEAVKKFAKDDKNLTTLASLYRVLGQLEYQQENYVAAAKAFADGVEILPNDMEFNNNLAYTRAKYLNDLEGALAPAEHAVKISPANSPALDTLGWIYYRLGRLGQAKQKIIRAMNNAQGPLERGGAFLHMAQILFAEGDRIEARKYADFAGEIIEQYPAIGVEFNTDFDALMTDLQEAENTK